MSGSILLGSAVYALLALAPPSTPTSDIDQIIGSRKPIARGSIAARKTVPVSIGGRRTAKTGDLAAKLFADHTSFASELSRGKASLFGSTVVTDEVVDLKTSTILTRTTKIVVKDPGALRKVSPTFARIRSGKAVGGKLSDLSAAQRKALAAYKLQLDKQPADHPLRKAAAKGDQALLDAIGDGAGEMSMTTTVTIPKGAPKKDKKGHVVPLARAADGSYADPPLTSTEATVNTTILTAPSPEPETTESGDCKHTTKFLAGFTEGDKWDYHVRFDIPAAWFRFKASAWYGYGLRIPIEVTSVQSPKTIKTTGDHDVDSEYDVTLSATTKDAGASFYEDVGLKGYDVHEGKELVLETGFSVNLHAEVLGAQVLDKTIPAKDGLSYDKDFLPPFGNCGTTCGFDVWVPADVTKTEIDLVVAKGSARAGVKIAGTGSIDIDFEALAGEGTTSVVDSWLAGAKKDAAHKQKVSLSKSSQTRKLVASVAALKNQSKTKSFGHRLSNPRYTWDVALIPGVRADIDIKVWPFKDSFPIGPFWFESLALELGSVPFGPHEGTATKVETVHGRKTWKNK